jgi:AcrR family transcriptional regulator
MPPSYVSPLREAQAAQTRRRLLEAAADEFGSSGYSGTSLGTIAKAAGVSTETVKQNGPKASLLFAAFDLAFAGTEGEGPLHYRELGAQAAPLQGQEFLDFHLGFVARANRAVARLWPRLLEAAAADATVAERFAAQQANRKVDMLRSIETYRAKGLCHSSRPDQELADAFSFLISPEGYGQLVLEAGWSDEAYGQWLQRAVRELILADRGTG